MSSGDPKTRQLILDAARALLEEHPGQSVSMSDVASRAGVSRQALYLHFADRAGLITEVTRELDTSLRTPARQRRVDEAATGREALREAVALQAWLKPRLRGVATALDVLRRSDPAAAAAWKEREEARLARCVQVVRRLRADGDLAPGWSIPDAARTMWAITSQRVWDDLVVDQGISSTRYRDHLTTVLEAALLTPRRGSRAKAPSVRASSGGTARSAR